MMDLEPIKDMLSKISGAPWCLDDDGGIESKNGGAVCHIQPHGSLLTVSSTGENFSHADGKLIADAPTIIKSLIEEIERLRRA